MLLFTDLLLQFQGGAELPYGNSHISNCITVNLDDTSWYINKSIYLYIQITNSSGRKNTHQCITINVGTIICWQWCLWYLMEREWGCNEKQLTMERHATPCSILSTTVFCYALIRPCVLLLKTRNLQNGVRSFQFDFVWERNVTGSSPADLRNWTVKPEQSHH